MDTWVEIWGRGVVEESEGKMDKEENCLVSMEKDNVSPGGER